MIVFSGSTGSTAFDAPPAQDRAVELRHPPAATPQPIDTRSVALVIIAAGIVFYALYSAQAIIFPLVLASFIALPLRPIVRRLEKLWLPRFLAAILVAALFLGSLVAGTVWLAGPAEQWLEDIPAKLQQAEFKLRAVAEPLEDVNEASRQVEELTENAVEPEVVKVNVQQPQLSSTVLSITGDFVTGAVITLSLAFLLLLFGDDLLESVVDAFSTRSRGVHVEQAWFDVERTISRYLFTSTLINVVFGVAIGFGLWALGMPNPVLWGVMAAVLNYIPFVGLGLGTLVVFAVAVLSFDSAAYACLAPAIYLSVKGVEATAITPALLGRSMKLSLLVTFLAVVLGGWMWGFGGAILATPALTVAKIICDHSDRMSGISDILTG